VGFAIVAGSSRGRAGSGLTTRVGRHRQFRPGTGHQKMAQKSQEAPPRADGRHSSRRVADKEHTTAVRPGHFAIGPRRRRELLDIAVPACPPGVVEQHLYRLDCQILAVRRATARARHGAAVCQVPIGPPVVGGNPSNHLRTGAVSAGGKVLSATEADSVVGGDWDRWCLVLFGHYSSSGSDSRPPGRAGS
jgi:hypothetical protein